MTKPFLQHIAEFILKESGDSLKDHCFVFPNRRSGLFFSRYLAEASEKPLWSPHITTISELIGTFSSLSVAEPDLLAFELYKAYSSAVKNAESFDSFYFWGEMLTSDFDNIDKYLVDYRTLFSNIKDIKDIDRKFESLTDDQVEIIREFWVNFGRGNMTDEKRSFIEIWDSLPEIYGNFKTALRKKGIAYEGMIFRDLAEMSLNGLLPDLKYSTYHFAGFNALSKCERVFLGALRKKGIAKFYWDYEKSFVDDKTHPAGYFIRQNLIEFGDDLPSASYSSDAARIRKWKIIDAPSDISQVKVVSQLLSACGPIDNNTGHQTAVILADENLLVPIITSLPPNADPVNITMGYPLRYSPIYSLARYLFSLAKNSKESPNGILFRTEDVKSVLSHSWIVKYGSSLVNNSETGWETNSWVNNNMFAEDTFLAQVFKKPVTCEEASSWLRTILESLFIVPEPGKEEEITIEARFRNEFIYRSCLAVNRLAIITSSSGVGFTVNTWFRLCEKVLRSVSVPFSGEPLSGLQVMGILETRALDFRNIYMLSVNEGVLPKNSVASSVIPNNLREAFGLPASRHQDSIFAYYFYRLTGRAENVTFLYNSSSAGLQTGEMSRYLLQMKYLSESAPREVTLTSDVLIPSKPPDTIIRSEEHHKRITELFAGENRRPLSPGALNTWLNCRMRFFYRYVAGLKEPDKKPVETDPMVFGQLLHKTMEILYLPLLGRLLNSDDLRKIAGSESLLTNAATKAAEEVFGTSERLFTEGAGLLITSIIKKYVSDVIKYDSLLEELSITALEKKYSAGFVSGNSKIIVGGVVDRFDSVKGVARIVDYKTGTVADSIPSIGSLFVTDDNNRSEAWFQVLVYCEIINRIMPEKPVRPGIYTVRDLHSPKKGDDMLLIKRRGEETRIVEDYNIVRPEFNTLLEELICKIMDAGSSFQMTEVPARCNWCPYRKLCRR